MLMIHDIIIFFAWSFPTSANACFIHSPPSRLPFWFLCPLRWGGLLRVAPGLRLSRLQDMDHKVNDWWQFLWPLFHHHFLHGNLHHQVPHAQSMCLSTGMFVVFLVIVLQIVCFLISMELSEYWLHTPHVFRPSWSTCHRLHPGPIVAGLVALLNGERRVLACVTLQYLRHAMFVESLLVVRKATNS